MFIIVSCTFYQKKSKKEPLKFEGVKIIITFAVC